MRPQTRFWFAIVYDDKNHGGGITERESWGKNHDAGNMEEDALRLKDGGIGGGGIIEEESLRRNHGERRNHGG